MNNTGAARRITEPAVVCSSGLNLSEAIALSQEGLVRSGAVLLRPGDEHLYRELSARLADGLVRHHGAALGYRNLVDSVTTGTDLGGHAIPWHAEGSYRPGQPDLLFFYCRNPGSTGRGVTLLADGNAVLDSLTEEERLYVRAARVVYTIRMSSSVLDEPGVSELMNTYEHGGRTTIADDTVILEWQAPLVVSSPISGLESFCNYFADALGGFGIQQPEITMEDASPVRDERIMRCVRAADSVAYEAEWKAGDIVIIDNWRVMHARPWYRDPSREVWLRQGYGINGWARAIRPKR